MPIHSRLLRYIFFFTDPATTEIYTLSLHDALPIFLALLAGILRPRARVPRADVEQVGLRIVRHAVPRSEEHTSELQSPVHLVCRLLLEKKNGANASANSSATRSDSRLNRSTLLI